MNSYRQFLASKRLIDPATGITDPPDAPAFLFPHQRDITRWALRRGRAAVFAGTGLGKTAIELTWASAVADNTGLPVLIMAPLAVAAQHIREAEHFGFAACLARSQDAITGAHVYVTNYGKMDHFDLPKFGGIVLDESSILKSHDGKTRARLIAECRGIPFRLCATATPAPNDFMELGNHAEFLGIMTYAEMLAMFFVHDGGETQKWRLKGHAQTEFWEWMAQWSVMLRKPSDLGYPNDGYDLPPLRTQQHTAAVEYRADLDAGTLFPVEAKTMQERIGARRSSIGERVEIAAQIVISDFRSKLATWQKDPKAIGSDTTPSIGQSGSLDLRIMRTPTSKNEGLITELITKPTSIDGKSGRWKSELNTTKSVADATPPIQNLPLQPRLNPDPSTNSLNETVASNRSSASTPLSTTSSLKNRVEDARFAMSETETISGDGSALTIVTIPERSEEFFAATAISASVNSATIPTDWLVQSNIFGTLVVEPWIIWCQINAEQEALKAAFGDLAISITGSQPDDEKERLMLAWLDRRAPVLITKSTIFGFGMNLQCCRNMIFVGLNDSFEQVYQAIRRCWRFGQVKPVTAHFIASELEGAVVANLRRKEADAEHMAEQMVAHMADLSAAELHGSSRMKAGYAPRPVPLPAFLEARP